MAKEIHLPALISVPLFSLNNLYFAHAADSSMNIACGVTGNFTDSDGNKWVGDGSFATMGRPAKVSSYYSASPPLNTLRYFYGEQVICYSFKLVPIGTLVTVTTQFFYGNYDGKYSPPSFSVKYDSNDMYAVVTNASSVVRYRLSYTTRNETIFVCLGTPYPYTRVLFLNTLQISGPGVDPGNNTSPSAGNNALDNSAPKSTGSQAASSTNSAADDHTGKKKTATIIAIVVSIVVGLPLLVGLGVLLCRLLSSQRRRANDIPQVPIGPGPPGNPGSQEGYRPQLSQGPPGDPRSQAEYLPPVSQGLPGDPRSPAEYRPQVSQGLPGDPRSPAEYRPQVSQDPVMPNSGSVSQTGTSQASSSTVQINEITNNFKTRIGKGGSGVVYYGQLKDRREVAVKVLNDSLPQGAKEFAAEVQLLLTVHHKCIAGFVGYCEEGQSLILIYEYMKGGNLRELLSDSSGRSAILTWEKRLQMAQSIATGLDYLYSGCQKPIIHRDVKTTNVLLNQKMEAKIADFGLSKAGIDEDVTFMSTVVAGTPGYIDPEYYQTNRLTTKSDVYSFVVVLLELISGHTPIMTAPDGKRYSLVQWAVPQIEGNDIESVADPRLRGQYDAESMWRVAQKATACLLESSEQRPTMEDVVSEIKVAIDVQTRLGATTVDRVTGGFQPALSPSGFPEFSRASTYSNADQYAGPSYKGYGPPPGRW